MSNAVVPVGRFKTVYWRLASRLASPTAYAATLLRPVRCRLARNNRHRVFAVDFNNDKIGFFANLNACLPLLYFCEAENLKPHLAFTSPNYLDRRRGASWFDYFFVNASLSDADLIRVRRREIRVCTVRSARELGFSKSRNREYYLGISIQKAHELVRRFIRIKPEVQAEVDRFAARHFQGRTVLAVHFRGTDKVIEAPRVAWAYCRDVIERYITANPQIDCIFIASDEGGFIDFIGENFAGIAVCHHDDHHRSTDGRAVHLDPGAGDNYFKGEDALVNCLLMSRCHALVKSASLLSAWATIFNPALPVILLNRPHREEDLWFPESEIVARSLDAYLAP